MIAVPAYIASGNGSFPNAWLELYSRDVSASGAFFLTSDPYAVGTRVTVRMILTPGNAMGGSGKQAQVVVCGDVLRTEKEGMAVRFDRNYKLSTAREITPSD